MSSQHRPGWLKQTNKSHKQSKRSKRSIDRNNAGKVNFRSSASVCSVSSLARAGREARMNKASLLRKNKRQALIHSRRQGGASIGRVVGGAPRNVAIVYLSEHAELPSVLGTNELNPGLQSVTRVYEKEKFRVSYLVAGHNNLSVLDVVKVADLVCFVLPLCTGENEQNVKPSKDGILEKWLGGAVDEQGRQSVSVAKAQGLPAVVGIVQNLDGVPPKHRSAVKKQATHFFLEEFGDGTKCIIDDPPNKMTDANQALSPNQVHFLRAIMETSLKQVSWRAERSYMLGCGATYEPSDKVLKVSGYLRGRPMDVHQLVHIPGQGTFRVKQIDSTPDPNPVRPLRKGEAPPQTRCLAVAVESKMQSLDEEATPDMMAGEQTWPTQEEMTSSSKPQEDEIERQRKKLPEGTSDYQATWLLGMSDDEDEEEEDELSKSPKPKVAPKEVDDDFMNVDKLDTRMTLEEWKERQRDDVQFPDEVETPPDIPARERFAKYRGLKSFRASPWHPKELLPREYARIFQVDNPKRLENQILEEGAKLEDKFLNKESAAAASEMETNEDEYVVDPGQYVTIHIQGVPPNVLQDLEKNRLPLVVGALLKHEQKLSVVNCTVQKASAYEAPVKSKDEMLMSCGLWRRSVRPAYSENTINCDKHKFERFLHEGRWSVATVYAPLTFGTNVPVLMFDPSEGHQLVANGSILNLDADRIVLKKVVLTGWPVRVKKSWAVVRYMFYSPDDIRWFRPVDLWTKYGISGRILEPLGTHGLFKCSFSKPIKSNDTICMSLYKRVFPKPVTEFKDLQQE